MSPSRMWRDTVIVGLAMFAVFFGAGNLIVPPHVGFRTRTDWAPAILAALVGGAIWSATGRPSIGSQPDPAAG